MRLAAASSTPSRLTRPGTATPTESTAPSSRRDVGEGVDQALGTVGGGEPELTDDGAVLAERDPEALRPADVDADRCGSHASARAFSSRTVLRMRTSARRFTKPGSGTTSSITRSYRTSVPPSFIAVNT